MVDRSADRATSDQPPGSNPGGEGSRRYLSRKYMAFAALVVAAIVVVVLLATRGSDRPELSVAPEPAELGGDRVPAAEASTTPPADDASRGAEILDGAEGGGRDQSSDGQTGDDGGSAASREPVGLGTPLVGDAAEVRTGTLTVGTDILPGRYVADGRNCFWERYAAADLGLDDPVLGTSSTDGQAIVDLLSTDAEFLFIECGPWAPYEAPADVLSSFADGEWLVGSDISPGVYSGPGGPTCRWQRVSGFTGSYLDVIETGNVASGTGGPTEVRIDAEDIGFRSTSCGTWSAVG